MTSNKKECKCCGSTYEYCNKCSKYASQPKWKWKCCTEECNDLFDTVAAYKMGIGDKDKIKLVLDRYNVSDYSKYKESISSLLYDLFGNNKKSKKNNKKKEMDIELKEEIVVENITFPIEQEISEFNGISDLM